VACLLSTANADELRRLGEMNVRGEEEGGGGDKEEEGRNRANLLARCCSVLLVAGFVLPLHNT
jgi:hypothetical protein